MYLTCLIFNRDFHLCLLRIFSMEHFLRQIVHDNRNPIEIVLFNNNFTLGRSALRDPIPFSGVSRSHARLTKVNEKWFIQDLSINGTYINQSIINRGEVKEIKVGDHIGLGVAHPSQGFVCALCIRPIQVIDLDDSPPMEIEQPLNDQDCQRSIPQPVTDLILPDLATNPVECSILPESSDESNEDQLNEDSFSQENHILIESSHSYTSIDSPHNQNDVLPPNHYESPQLSPNYPGIEINEGKDETTLQNSYFPCQKVISEGQDETTLQNSYFPCQKVISSTLTLATPSTSNACTVFSELRECALNAAEDIHYQDSVEDDSGELRCNVKIGRINPRPLSESDSEELQFVARKRGLSSDSDSEDIPYSQSEDVFEIDSDDKYYDFDLSQVVNNAKLVNGVELGAISIDKSNQDKIGINSVQCSDFQNVSECQNSAIASNFPSHDEDNFMSSNEIVGDVIKLREDSSFILEKKDTSGSSCSSHNEVIIPTKFKISSKKSELKRKNDEESTPNLTDKGHKKKAPTITRKLGKLSRNEMLALELQNLPNRTASKPPASSRIKSTHLSSLKSMPSKSSETTSEVLNKTIDGKKKHSLIRGNSKGTTLDEKNKGNTTTKAQCRENCQPESRSGNLCQPGVSNPEVYQDLGLNRENRPKPMDNYIPVYPAADKFTSDSMDVESNVPMTTNLMSKYGPTVSKPVVSTKAQTGVSSLYSKENLIEKIVNLNPMWLKEQNEIAEFQHQRGLSDYVRPPSDVIKSAGEVPLSFNSLDEYVRAFTPLLLLEIWETLCDSWKNRQSTQDFYYVILENHKNSSYQNAHICTLREFECESIVNKMSFHPVRGSVVILDIQSSQTSQVQSVFGFVHYHIIEESRGNDKIREVWKKCETQRIKDGKMYKFKVFIKDRDFNITTQHMLMKGSGLCNINAKVDLMDNFLHLSESPLCPFILSPNNKGFSMELCGVNPGRNEFNGDQMLAINTICREMNDGPKIMLLRGPPGTGKSHTLIGLLDTMVFSCNLNVRILVVAHSNEAIDEIGRRLIILNQQSQRGILKFVRVGAPNRIGKALQNYTVESKLKEVLDQEVKSKGEEIQKCREEIVKLQKRKTLKAREEIDKLEEKITMKTRVLSLFLKNPQTQEAKIWKDSNIVLSTLRSCSKALTSDSSPFSCVIVDEAAAVNELELLQIMPLKMRKLILIGDEQQLPPTVLSNYAKDFGLERSMFERLQACLTEKGLVPSLMLKEQYRMHPEICKFPSKHFYQNKLVTSQSILHRDENLFSKSFQKPYLVFDIPQSQSGSETISIETCVVNLCEQLTQRSLSVGVITPYQNQCSIYAGIFKDRPEFSDLIKVKIAEGFQGQEKDAIILSCVCAFGSEKLGFLVCPKRLNVAITRAKRILIICGCLSTLKQNPDWEALIDDARERNLVYSVTSVKDIPLLFQPIT